MIFPNIEQRETSKLIMLEESITAGGQKGNNKKIYLSTVNYFNQIVLIQVKYLAGRVIFNAII